MGEGELPIDIGKQIGKAAEESTNPLRRRVGEIASSWVVNLIPAANPRTINLQETPFLRTQEEREATIQTGLELAREAINQSVLDPNYTLEGGWTYDMDAVLRTKMTPSEIIKDGDVLEYVVAFLERAHEKKWGTAKHIMDPKYQEKLQIFPFTQASKKEIQALIENDPYKKTADKIRATWAISPKPRMLGDLQRVKSERRLPQPPPSTPVIPNN